MFKKLKTYAKRGTLFSAISTLLFCVYLMGNSYTAAKIAFIVWAITPYLFLAFLINLAANKVTTITTLAITIITCLLGLVTFISSILSHLDAQSGLVFIDTPLWQWTGLLVVTLPLVLLNKLKNQDHLKI
ncbi:MAG: hypothetical protein OQK46_00415 [Gammaproteobacteria bacterium]|nr:hypothetical protein [Gammaproteobacteria bacterium]